MKREIKFKAISVHTKKWVKGYYYLGDLEEGGKHCIRCNQETAFHYEVYSETICESIGITSSDKVDIHRGDYIMFKLPTLPVLRLPIIYKNCSYGVMFNSSFLTISDILEESEIYSFDGKNIHDKK